MTSIYIHSILLITCLIALTASIFIEDYTRTDMVTVFVAMFGMMYSFGYLALMIAIITKGSFV